MQSEFGRQLAAEQGLNPEFTKTILLLHDQKVFRKNEAILEILGMLPGLWRYIKIFKIIPRFMRDWLYDNIAANRYRWFGRKKSCLIPKADVLDRFISL